VTSLSGSTTRSVERRPRVPWWVIDGVFAVIIVAAPFAPEPWQDFRPTTPLGWILSFAPAVILPLRRKWPIPILGVLLAVYGAATFTGTLSIGAGLAVAVAMFRVGARVPRRRAIIVAAVAVPAIVALSLPIALTSVFEPRILQFGLFVALAGAIGDATRSRREYVEAIVERAERAEQTREAEARQRVSEARLQIARDLHDTVAHQIAVISLNAGAATAALETRPEQARDALAHIREASRTVLGEIGSLLTVLRSDEAAASEPQPTLERLEELIEGFRPAGLEVTRRVEGDLARTDGIVGTVAYRVVQEALTNGHKHSSDQRAHVLVVVGDDVVSLLVTNRMASPDSSSAAWSSGFGLLGLRERVASVRGTLDVGPSAGMWEVHAVLPLTNGTSA
jgi:signal transduction histidine kinase